MLGLLDDAAAADLQLDGATVRAGAVALAKAGQWELASWLLAGAERGRPAPSRAIAAVRVEVCGRGAQWRRAVDVALGPAARGAELDAAVCGAAVSACAKAGRWAQAVALVEALRQHGLEPTSWVYEAAVYACRVGRSWHSALGLVGQMQLRGLRAGTPARQELLRALKGGAPWELGLEALLPGPGAPGHRTSAEAAALWGHRDVGFNMRIAACPPRHWRHAANVLARMRAEGVPPTTVIQYNIISYNMML